MGGALNPPGRVDGDKPNSLGVRGLNTYAETGWHVLEWTADCWLPKLRGIPMNGTPRTAGDCVRGVVRGSLANPFIDRGAGTPGISEARLGFRVVRSPLGGPLSKVDQRTPPGMASRLD